jgi:hypothetical protein
MRGAEDLQDEARKLLQQQRELAEVQGQKKTSFQEVK